MIDVPRRRPRHIYSREIADQICALVADGHSLRKIVETPGMPCRQTFVYWLYDYPEFREKYEIARILQAEFWSHEILEIAETSVQIIRVAD